MINTQKLRGRLVEAGLSVDEVAVRIGKHPSTLYRHLSNSDLMTIREANEIAAVLKMTASEAMTIFFAPDVA